MTQQDITQLDVRKVLEQKAPGMARKLPDFLINYLIRTIHQDELNDILTRYHDKEGVDFMEALVNYFNLTIRVTGEEHLPEEGRFIFASNHPLGGLDGICLSYILGKRYEGRIHYLVNDVLLHIPQLRSIFIPINKYGKQRREGAVRIDEAYASGNQIITFPAGLCSRRSHGKITDPEWKKSFIQKAIEHQRDIIPVFFSGKNSNFFYRLSNLRKKLGIKANIELIYLPDEMFRNKYQTFDIIFGEPIPWQTFDSGKKQGEWTEWVKEKVYQLNPDK